MLQKFPCAIKTWQRVIVLFDCLASLGYYDHDILLAKPYDDQYEERDINAKAWWAGVLHNSVTHFLSQVFQVGLNLTSNPLTDSMESDEDLHRRALSQLRRSTKRENPFVE